MTEIVEMYMEGLTIEEICEETWWDEEAVLNLLRGLKKKDSSGKGYAYKFKEMVVERMLTGATKGHVVKELGVSYRTIDKYLEEFNAEVPKNKKKHEEEMFREIEWTSFTVCPECKGVHVNDLNLYMEDGVAKKNSYCLDCGTEWLERGDKVYKVLWEFVK